MDRVQNVYLQAYLSYRGLVHWLTPFPYFSNFVRAPFLTLLNFILGRGHRRMVVYAIVWIYVGSVTQSFSNDRSGGTLHLLFGSPASRASAYFARGVGHFYNVPLMAVSTTLLAVLVIDLNAGELNYLTYTVAIVVVSIGILMLSLLLGNFAALYHDWFLFSSIGYGGLLGLTGLIIPRRPPPCSPRSSSPGAADYAWTQSVAGGLRRRVGGKRGPGPPARTGGCGRLRARRACRLHAHRPGRPAARHPRRR